MKARRKKPGIRAVDPKEKEKDKEKPKARHAKGRRGTAAVVKRNKNGELEAVIRDDFAGVTQETMKADRKTVAGTGDGTYSGGVAPRVGGRVKIRKSPPVKGGTKSMVRKAKRRVRRSGASKAAKRAAIRAYK